MSEQGKDSLLLPLGIGAGLLLLLTSMKKKDAPAPTATVAPDDAATLLPEITAASAAVPQIDPAPAPSYSQAVAKTASGEEEEPDEDSVQQDEPEDAQQQSDQPSEDDEESSNGQDDEDDGSNTPSYASKSGGGGGSYTPYRPTSTINTNRQTTPLPAPSYTNAQAAPNRQILPVNKSIRFQSDQAKKLALQKLRNNKSIRFQSDQAKQFAARSGATNNPLFIGNGKPRMGVRLPVTQRPGATAVTASTTAAMPAVNITSQPAATTASTPVQTSIFPLKFGTTSPYVKEVQRKLGVSATGYFGTMTRAALQKRFRVSEISEALYKQIITGKAPVRVIPVRKPVVKPVAKPIHKIKKPLPKKFKTVKRK